MKTMAETLTSFFNDKGIKFQQLDEVTYRLGYEGKHACFNSFVAIDEDAGKIVMETFLPVRVSPEKNPIVAETVIRLNSEDRNGFLDLNLKHGHLVYKTNLLPGTSELQSNMVGHLIFSNWLSADYCFPLISAVLFGNITPEKAIDDSETSNGSNKKHKKKKPPSGPEDMSQILRGRLDSFTNN